MFHAHDNFAFHIDVDKNAGQETFYCASGAKYSLNLSRSVVRICECRQGMFRYPSHTRYIHLKGFTEGVVFNSSRTKVEFREGIIGKTIPSKVRGCVMQFEKP